MKHIITINIFLIVLSAFCAYFFFYKSAPTENIYMQINKKIISEKEFQDAFLEKAYYQSPEEFFEQYIETELLIQKAIDLNLHQNSKFRSKIKSFYEKNLVQLLMEKKISEFNIKNVDNRLISRYQKIKGTKIRIADSINKKDIVKEFTFLDSEVKFLLLKSKKDSFCKKNCCYKIIENNSNQDTVLNEDFIIKEVKALRGQYLWNNWIKNLKENAEIDMFKVQKGKVNSNG